MKYLLLALVLLAGNLAITIVRGPLEALGGVVYGILIGIALWYFPSRKHVSWTLSDVHPRAQC